jgi:hypothetical protein
MPFGGRLTLNSKLENTPRPRKETDQYVKDCCASETLYICSEMQRLLPRELRDMVYVVILGERGMYDIRSK